MLAAIAKEGAIGQERTRRLETRRSKSLPSQHLNSAKVITPVQPLVLNKWLVPTKPLLRNPRHSYPHPFANFIVDQRIHNILHIS